MQYSTEHPRELLKNWNIGDISRVDPAPSYWGNTLFVTTVDHRCFVLKKKPDRLLAEQEFALLCRLSETGVPVAVPVLTVDAAWYALGRSEIFCLYPRLPGEIIAEHYAGEATARAESMGKAIGFLHTCLLKCDDLSGYQDMQLMKQIEEWALPCIREHKAIIDGDLIESIWSGVEQEMRPLDDKLPKQLIHRDPHPANMLFDSGQLTGFVDFEMVTRGPRIFDVCYCGTSLLVSGYPDIQKMQSWPALFDALVKGYQQVIPLTSAERRAVYGVLAAIELLFAAFSLENQAEEAARCNASVLNWLSMNRERITI